MGIYDPVLQAYQHGVDQRIQLASQPMTLAQSILGGYQQGFGNRMQQEHLGLQRDQFGEQKRHAMEQERLSKYGMDQRFESQAQAREAKARIEQSKLMYRQQADAAKNALLQEANNLRARGLEQQARMIDAKINQIDATVAEIEKQSDAKTRLLEAQAWGIYNKPEQQQGLLGIGTVGQERDLFGLFRAAMQSDTAQRGQDVRDVPGSLGVTERPQRIAPMESLQGLDLQALSEMVKRFKAGTPSGGATKIIEKSKKKTNPKPPAQVAPAPPPAPAVEDVPPAPWEQ
jgi:hypothetical protein